jgi:hypothetical protein
MSKCFNCGNTENLETLEDDDEGIPLYVCGDCSSIVDKIEEEQSLENSTFENSTFEKTLEKARERLINLDPNNVLIGMVSYLVEDIITRRIDREIHINDVIEDEETVLHIINLNNFNVMGVDRFVPKTKIERSVDGLENELYLKTDEYYEHMKMGDGPSSLQIIRALSYFRYVDTIIFDKDDIDFNEFEGVVYPNVIDLELNPTSDSIPNLFKVFPNVGNLSINGDSDIFGNHPIKCPTTLKEIVLKVQQRGISKDKLVRLIRLLTQAEFINETDIESIVNGITDESIVSYIGELLSTHSITIEELSYREQIFTHGPLVILHLRDCEIQSLPLIPIQFESKLETLDLDGNKLIDIKNIRQFIELSKVNLIGNSELTDFTPLLSLPKLQTVSVDTKHLKIVKEMFKREGLNNVIVSDTYEYSDDIVFDLNYIMNVD